MRTNAHLLALHLVVVASMTGGRKRPPVVVGCVQEIRETCVGLPFSTGVA